MKPLEFVLWLNGAAGILGDTPPSPEQWKQIHDNLAGTIGPIVAAKLLDRADALVDEDEVKRNLELEKAKLMQQYLTQQLYANKSALSNDITRQIYGYSDQLAAYSTGIGSSTRGR